MCYPEFVSGLHSNEKRHFRKRGSILTRRHFQNVKHHRVIRAVSSKQSIPKMPCCVFVGLRHGALKRLLQHRFHHFGRNVKCGVHHGPRFYTGLCIEPERGCGPSFHRMCRRYAQQLESYGGTRKPLLEARVGIEPTNDGLADQSRRITDVTKLGTTREWRNWQMPPEMAEQAGILKRFEVAQRIGQQHDPLKVELAQSWA